MRRKLEYAAAWPFLKIMGVLPRPLARAFAIGIAQLVYLMHFRLRQVGMRNLEMVFPEKSLDERRRTLRGVFTSLGRQLAELCQFPRYTAEESLRKNAKREKSKSLLFSMGTAMWNGTPL